MSYLNTSYLDGLFLCFNNLGNGNGNFMYVKLHINILICNYKIKRAEIKEKVSGWKRKN